jgi:hypothetical protein
MAKAVALTAADLNPVKPRAQSVMRQRGVVPSADLVPLQFRYNSPQSNNMSSFRRLRKSLLRSTRAI